MPAEKNKKYIPKKSSKEPPIRLVFRTNLRNRRVSLGISQRELGDLTCTSQSYIQQLESARKEEWGITPSLLLQDVVAQALQTTPATMLTPNAFGQSVGPDDDMREHRVDR